MRLLFTGIAISCALLLAATVLLPNERWLVIYGSRAENYAERLLLGEADQTPDWAIDLVISKSGRIVTFAHHGESTIFAFSPDGMPDLADLIWQRKWSNWYVSDTET